MLKSSKRGSSNGTNTKILYPLERFCSKYYSVSCPEHVCDLYFPVNVYLVRTRRYRRLAKQSMSVTATDRLGSTETQSVPTQSDGA